MTDKTAKKDSNLAPDGASVVVDWDAIEQDYRIGIKTMRQIATEHGITHGAVNKRAKRDGWDRDLSAKIKARADALVSKATVSKQVSKEQADTERNVIEANAEAIVIVRLSQRKDIGRSRTLAMRLLEELEQQSAQVPDLSALGEMMHSPDDRGIDKLNELYQKIISLPGRTKTMKDLGDTLKTLIGLERQAFGLDTAPPTNADPFMAMLHRIAQGNTSALQPVVNDPAHDED